ncbi:MAG: hypothetical protein AAF828_06120, partial [Bacteroidota bacterium]
MKNPLYLLFTLAVLLFAASCGDDDEAGTNIAGTGGQDGDLIIRLTWEQTNADLDLDLELPNGNTLTPRTSPTTTLSVGGDDVFGPGNEFFDFNNSA